MDAPEIRSAKPNVPPNIRRAPGLTLTIAEESLLARAFAGSREIFVEREFRSGYSGAVVLLVSPGPGQAQMVVKLGTPTDLHREYTAYQQFVKRASPQNTARLQGQPLLTDDEQLALISYTFAGGDPRWPTHSLQAYYESQGGQAVAAVLDRIFRVYGRQWWAINRPQKFVISEHYDRLLPVHLKLKPAVTAETNARTLVSGQINGATLNDLQPGQLVRLQGFRVTEIRPDRQEVNLIADPPPGEASAPFRLRLETDQATTYQPGNQLETLDAIVIATRQSLLIEAAATALPSFEPEAASLNLNGRTYPNPLRDLPALLEQVTEARVSTIHGDLNLQNVLVDGTTGFAWLIDFAETRRGPTLFDLQRLESQVITKLLPPALTQAGLDLTAVADLLEALHTDPPRPLAPYRALQEPYTILVTIRRLARQYLMDDRIWDEYYLGLVIVLLGSLKYADLGISARALALVDAAVVWGLMGKNPAIDLLTPVSGQIYLPQRRSTASFREVSIIKPLPIQPRRRSRRFYWVASVLVVLVLWVSLGMGLWFWLISAPAPPLAMVIDRQGQVDVYQQPHHRTVTATFGLELFASDVITTYEASNTTILCENGLLFHLADQTKFDMSCAETTHQPPVGQLPPELSQQLIQRGTPLRFDTAVAEQTIRISPLSARAKSFLRARLYYNQNQHLDKAIFELEQLVSRGEGPELAQTLGDLYFQAGEFDRAEKYYTAALNEAQFGGDLSSQAVAYVSLGYLAKANNDSDLAIANWQIAEALYRQESHIAKAECIAAFLRSNSERNLREQLGDLTVTLFPICTPTPPFISPTDKNKVTESATPWTTPTAAAGIPSEHPRQYVTESPGYQALAHNLAGLALTSATFSPSGEEIAVTEGANLYVVARDNSYLEVLMKEDSTFRPKEGIVWSPDGQYIAFVAVRKQNCQACQVVGLVRLSDGWLHYLEAFSNDAVDLPRWIQDGGLLVTVHQGNTAYGQTYIYDTFGHGEMASGSYLLSSSHQGQTLHPWFPGKAWEVGQGGLDSYYDY